MIAFHWHPVFFYFPFAFLVLSFACFCIYVITHRKSFHNFALYLLVFALIGAIAAGLSGESAAGSQSIADPVLKHLVNRHESFANLTIWGSIAVTILWIFGYKKYSMDSFFKWVILLLLVGLTVAVLITGYLGGELVYLHGVGVLQ